MKRRNFLGWMAGALVAAREAFVGDVEADETIPAQGYKAPPVFKPNPTPEPGLGEMILNYDGQIIRAAVDNVTIDYRAPESWLAEGASRHITITVEVAAGYSTYDTEGKGSKPWNVEDC